MRRATIKDVAKLAGVSTTTVSHVVNNTRRVEENTRLNVMNAMQSLGYTPNVLARGLRRGESKTLALIVADITNPFFAQIARWIENLAFEQGYSVILANSDNDSQKQRDYVNIFISKQVDGVIFISTGDSDMDLLRLESSHIPFVVADRDVPNLLTDVILLDNENASYAATKHLIDLGHTKIACISGPQHLAVSAERARGYQRAMAEANLPVEEGWMLHYAFQCSGGEEAMQQLLQGAEMPSAVFAANDLLAIGAMTAAKKAGLNIPQALSIIGFDDIEMAAAITPALTTMAQPIELMARAATETLIARIQNADAPKTYQKSVFDAALVVRESTQPAGGRHG